MKAKPDTMHAADSAAVPLHSLLAPSGEALLAERDSEAAVREHGFFHKLSARVYAWFEFPFGYQDEHGFHYGRPDDWDRDHAPGCIGSRLANSGATTDPCIVK